ncbi:addiction module protein [Agriterribacter sp.]|uniref:addiction module protein n=1 Tax=Agriterribacter sp. TaxID=2821509 RepID=UPI002B68A068|nr:addiction module protein [Agriterribacter sp.]HRO45308.1 addiction module protein [Agriterribacter sp.]HRQ17131.1 addiction module protein [Agriterribacter sp.]
MPYNKKELLALPDKEKMALAEELWDSLDESIPPITDEEIAFAEERLKMHEANPEDGLTWEEFRDKIRQRHGF